MNDEPKPKSAWQILNELAKEREQHASHSAGLPTGPDHPVVLA